MRLHEYEAAKVFEAAGIKVPKHRVVQTPQEALDAAEEIGYPVMLKAQVLVGGRGLAGGIKIASDASELKELAGKMTGSEIRGVPVDKIMISEKANISSELYVAVTVDGYSGKPVVIASTEGGVNIEENARKRHIICPLNLQGLCVIPIRYQKRCSP